MMAESTFATEADLVASFCASLAAQRGRQAWTPYHETGGFDLLLVQVGTGIQLGIEAKLAFNLKVMVQALPDLRWSDEGPDYRAILVPRGKAQAHLSDIAARLGLGVIGHAVPDRHGPYYIDLPDEDGYDAARWFPWLPTRRCALPDYVPDVVGGHSAPIQLTHWKIKAIKLCVLLDRRGFVTRSDMKALGISPSFWTQPGGYLAPRNGHYVRCQRTPDFRVQHPANYSEIEADFAKWGRVWIEADAVSAKLTARIMQTDPERVHQKPALSLRDAVGREP